MLSVYQHNYRMSVHPKKPLRDRLTYSAISKSKFHQLRQSLGYNLFHELKAIERHGVYRLLRVLRSRSRDAEIWFSRMVLEIGELRRRK
jgi:hypothetical protein